MNRQAARGSAGRRGAAKGKNRKPVVDSIPRLSNQSRAITRIKAMAKSPGGTTSAEIFSERMSEDMNEGLVAKKIHSIKK